MTKNINLIQHFLKVDEADLPTKAALGDRQLKSRGGSAMSAAGVKKDNVDLHFVVTDLSVAFQFAAVGNFMKDSSAFDRLVMWEAHTQFGKFLWAMH